VAVTSAGSALGGGRLGGSPDTAGQPRRPLRSPRASQIVDAARVLLESDGPDALTMRRLATDLGMRAPSIYKHFPAKRAIEVALIEEGLSEMGAECHRAISQPGREGPVLSLLGAYRRFSLAHPNLYRMATSGRLPREAMTPGLEDWAGEPWYLVTGDPHVAQALWSFAHGMVILELDERYPEDSQLDITWHAGGRAFESQCRPKPDGSRF
jgi:AcrR family transcriptional regulator